MHSAVGSAAYPWPPPRGFPRAAIPRARPGLTSHPRSVQLDCCGSSTLAALTTSVLKNNLCPSGSNIISNLLKVCEAAGAAPDPLAPPSPWVESAGHTAAPRGATTLGGVAPARAALLGG